MRHIGFPWHWALALCRERTVSTHSTEQWARTLQSVIAMLAAVRASRAELAQPPDVTATR